MAFATSSILGVDLNNASTTQLFALNTKVLGNSDSEWQYVYATAALATGQFVQIQSGGTANVLTTALLGGAGIDGSTGNLDLGVSQFTVAAGSYAYVAKKGSNMYIRCSGTCPPGALGFTDSGTLTTAGIVAVGLTALGVMIYTSASTATASVTSGLLTYPRPITATPLM